MHFGVVKYALDNLVALPRHFRPKVGTHSLLLIFHSLSTPDADWTQVHVPESDVV